MTTPNLYPRRSTVALRADFAASIPISWTLLTSAGYVWNTYHVAWLADKARPGPLSEIPDYFFRTIDLVKAQGWRRTSRYTARCSRPFTHFMELFGYEHALMPVGGSRQGACRARPADEASVVWAVAQARPASTPY